MAQCPCGNFFKLPESGNRPEEDYIYCYSCRTSPYSSIFSDKEYVLGGVCNPMNDLLSETESYHE